jgi:hypothetical protein
LAGGDAQPSLRLVALQQVDARARVAGATGVTWTSFTVSIAANPFGVTASVAVAIAAHLAANLAADDATTRLAAVPSGAEAVRCSTIV